MQGLDLAFSLDLSDLEVEGSAIIQFEKQLSSFNRLWDEAIAVPGAPAEYVALQGDITLPQDYKNPALPKYPIYKYRLEPLLRSIETMQPDFDLYSADIVCNVGVLENLFQFLNYSHLTERRLDLEWRNGTLLLSRWVEPNTSEISIGHGASFEQKTRRFDENLKRSTSHHRVHAYGFGGLKCVVQSEVDCYSCKCHSTNPSAKVGVNMFDLLTLDDPGDREYGDDSQLDSTVEIHHIGRHVPASCLLELKTRKHGECSKADVSARANAQLYFSRQTRLLIAFHNNATFQPQKCVEDKTEGLAEWEREEESGLGRLAALLRKLVQLAGDVATTTGITTTSIFYGYDKRRQTMCLYKRPDGSKLLPN
ncbi:hypothetical protein BX600DRAFT_515946 [Xylariales sp. PMI_506]|nr:hypothetical protein BX600DRAFT_515946 [Xylariales sp. PMI_506]